jgi:hypothetical protein
VRRLCQAMAGLIYSDLEVDDAMDILSQPAGATN